MIRKLFVASGIFHPEPGGPATYLNEILPQLQARDWDVRLVSYGDSPSHAYPYPVTRIRRNALPLRLLRYALAARPLLQWADLVYIHTIDLPLWGRRDIPSIIKIVGDVAWERAIRRHWIPETEDVDEFQTKRYGPILEWQKASRARQIRAKEGVIVPSEYLKRMVIAWGVAPEKISVIYNALPPHYQSVSLSQDEARQQLGLADGPLLLTAARLNPWKGVDMLIEALLQVPDVQLLVAGDGPEKARLEQLAEKIAHRVIFLGNVSRDKMPLYLKAADYLVLYSGYEGLSHTLLESLRAGTPIIASDKGGNPEVVRHDVNGLLVPYRNLDALVASLQTALQAGKRSQLAANQAIGMERFVFETMVQKTHDALVGFL